MDPFEVRMQFISLLRRLNASQQSIQKVVAYSLKFFSRCGDLIWDCIVEECQKGSLNTRINILYLLDSLCEASLISRASFGPSSSSSGGTNGNLYVDFVARDLATIVGYVVPPGREGLINLLSAVQILENWRSKRVLDPQKVDDVLSKLESQKADMHAAASTSISTAAQDPSQIAHAIEIIGEADAGGGSESLTFSRNEIFKRIEEDRERHKRLRERRWVQPIVHEKNVPVLVAFAPLPPEPQPLTHATVGNTNSASSNQSATGIATGAPELPLDIEFDNAWETTSDWNEDDEEAIAEENALCYPNVASRYGDASSVPQAFSSEASGPPPISSSMPSDPVSAGSMSSRTGPGSVLPPPGSGSEGMSPTMHANVQSQPTKMSPSAKRPIKIDRSRMLAERRNT